MDQTKIKSIQIPPTTTIKEGMQKLNETAEKILFVIDESENLLGSISDGDLRKGVVSGLELNTSIEKCVNRNYKWLPHNEPEPTERAKELMLEHKIEQIPLLRDGKISAIISWTDLFAPEATARPTSLTNPVVIMAGGKGSRLDPFTRILPKALVPVGEKAVIEMIMANFFADGFDHFIYSLNYKKEFIKAFLKENSYPYRIEWVEENDFLGTAGSLSLLKGKVNETFFVTNCDSILDDVNYRDILQWHKNEKAAMTIIGCHNEHKIPFGILEIEGGRLSRIAEKPVQDLIINTGVYVIEPGVIELIPEGTPIDMNTLLERVLEREKVSVYPVSGSWLDLGQWDEYKKTVDHFSHQQI